MLTNKKVLVRVIAFALVLVMTSAIFLGCKNDQTQADIEAAQQAAADAQKAAEDAAKLAEDLKAQLDATKKELEELQNKPADKDDSIKDPEFDGLTNKFVTEKVLAKFSALKAEYLTVRQNWYTNENYKKVAEIFEEAAYQLYRATSAEGVEAVINNAQTAADAVDNIVSDAAKVQALIAAFGDVDTAITLTNKGKVEEARKALEDYADKYAAVLDETDTAEILKKIDLITEGKVYINIDDENGLLKAEEKIDLLKLAAEGVNKEVLDVINEIEKNSGSEWDKIKPKAAALEAAYELYKRFYTLNGGDDAAIGGKLDNGEMLTGEAFVKEYVLVLFNKQFNRYKQAANLFLDEAVKFFENPADAKNKLNAYANDLKLATAYTYSYKDGAKLINEKALTVAGDKITVADFNGLSISIDSTDFTMSFKGVVANGVSLINAKDFGKDYKGVKTLAEAYREVDQLVLKTVIDMANSYFTNVIVPVIDEMVEAKKDYLNAQLASYNNAVATGKQEAFYADAYKVLVDDLTALWNDTAKNAADVTAFTYEKLNNRGDVKKYNISQTALFDMTSKEMVSDEIVVGTTYALVTSGSKSALTMIFDELNTLVDNALKTVYNADVKFVDELSFYEFKKELSEKLKVYADFGDDIYQNDIKANGTFLTIKLDIPVDGDDKTTNKSNYWDDNGTKKYTLVGAVAYYAGDDDIKRTDMFKFIGDLSYAKRVEIMALDYDAFSASTYNAKDADGDDVYVFLEDKFADMTASTLIAKDDRDSEDDTVVKIEIDKLTAAKNGAAKIMTDALDTMLGKLLDACRSNIKAELTAATDLYKNNYFGEQDKVLLQKDMDAYIAYMQELTDVKANLKYDADVADLSSVAKKVFAADKKVSEQLSGYFAEYSGSDKWIFHIRGLESAENVSGTENYLTYGDLFSTMTDDTVTTDLNEAEAKCTKILVNDKSIGTRKDFVDGSDFADNYEATLKANTEIKTYLPLNKAYALTKLADVKELAYYKDDVLNSDVDHDPESDEDDSLNIIYNKYVGKYDTEKKDWATKPVNAYDYGTLRSELYLANLAKVKAAIAEKVNAINLADDDYENFEDAKAVIDVIIDQATDETVTYNASEDDFSFEIVYDRYYEVNGYDWSQYKADK